MPAVGTMPPVEARPDAWVSRSNSPQLGPPSARAVWGYGIDPHSAHPRQVDHESVVAHGIPGHTVAAGSDRDEGIVLALFLL